MAVVKTRHAQPIVQPTKPSENEHGQPIWYGATVRSAHKWSRKKGGDPNMIQPMSISEAMRYIRAAEVGQNQKLPYDIAIKIDTINGVAPVRGAILFPKGSKKPSVVCVIADGDAAKEAREAGASIVGAEEVVAKILDGAIQFDKCIAHPDSFSLLSKVARILGPRNLMPSVKRGTVTKDLTTAIKDALGKQDYREQQGVVRLPIGQLDFTEEELETNIKLLMGQVKVKVQEINKTTKKSIKVAEIVLSSTHAPGCVIKA
ncbi:ribosomal protein L1 [Saitoella complicata NRRL Y-17804]|nr:ribosomal protein L1 [Saitoella complicata NRRL Y-17804]ODQ54132.1 ribosomal protein L1 [Saitoella complicata NRRL Y-17804]